MENLTGGTPPVRYLPCVVPCKLYFTGIETFDSLAYNSIYPMLIPKGAESRGYTVSSMLYPVLQVIMMPLAAVLLERIGVAWILIIQGALSVIAALRKAG